ncbi:TPA: hypothetical protein ACMEWZ_005951, partial [Klebsiella pneumoniae]
VTLRNAALKAWDTFATDYPVSVSFSEVFGTVCRTLDDPEHYAFEALKDELISALLQAIPAPGITYDRWLIELDPNEQNRRKLFGEPAPLPQHVIDADNNADGSGEPVPPTIAPSIPPEANNSVLTSASVPTLALTPEPLPEPTPVPTLGPTPAPAARERNIAAESAIAFANTGLEPVTDIWQVSALQDDPEHLQDAAFRLAFELAEVLEAESELSEDNAVGAVGYRLEVDIQQASPITRLLAVLAGSADASLSANALTDILFGTGRP